MTQQGPRHGKGKHRRADRDLPTLMENKKAFSLLLMPLQLMEITLNCFRIHICIMTLYTLGFKQPSKADLDIMRSRPVRTSAASNCTKLR